jgi:hypothetical protein
VLTIRGGSGGKWLARSVAYCQSWYHAICFNEMFFLSTSMGTNGKEQNDSMSPINESGGIMQAPA